MEIVAALALKRFSWGVSLMGVLRRATASIMWIIARASLS